MHVFDPTPCGLPSPRVPLLPRFSGRDFVWGAGDDIFNDGHCRFFSRGRYALLEAYRQAGVGPDGALLAPAYHCRTMLDAAVRLQGVILLYDQDASLAPLESSLETLIDQAAVPVRALLVPHFFGFPQALDSVAELCGRHGVVLIEDCSHAYFGLSGTRRLGTIGDYAIASPYKFFPCPDGGVLRVNCGSGLSAEPLKRPGLAVEAKAVLSLLRGIVHAGGDLPDNVAGEIESLRRREAIPPVEGSADGEFPSRYYVHADENAAGLTVSRWVVRHGDQRRLADLRRANYRHWLQVTERLPNCRPLYADLPEGCVPYMFPLLIDRPDVDFMWLKRLGVPIWRWDDLAVSSSRVAADYRLRLLHLPCHQSLAPTERRWMADALRWVMAMESP